METLEAPKPPSADDEIHRYADLTYERMLSANSWNPRLPSDEERQAYVEQFEKWQNGNFDPTTGLQTFYRFVDQSGVDSLNKYGGITSRAVQFFGNGSDIAAYDELTQLAQGTVTDTSRGVLEGFYQGMLQNKRTGEYFEKQRTALRQSIEAGVVSPEIQTHAKEAAERIATSWSQNPDAIFDINISEGGSSAMPRSGSLGELFATTLHTTTDPAVNFFSERPYRVTIKLYPGQLQPQGKVVGEGLVGEEPGSEWEWTGYGAIYPVTGESITIEKTEKALA